MENLPDQVRHSFRPPIYGEPPITRVASGGGTNVDTWLMTDDVDTRAVERSVLAEQARSLRGDEDTETEEDGAPGLAVRLHDLVVHKNRKWFDFLGGADARVDVVVVQGNVLDGQAQATAAYAPATFRFQGIGDGTRLPTDEQGLLAYYGWPKHFLDISVIVSRDRGDSDDLATLLIAQAEDPKVQAALTTLAGLAVANPPAAAVAAALGAAAALGNLAYQAIRQVSDKTIGLYRGNRLAYPDKFGLGRNPTDGSYRERDLSFWYEVLRTTP